MQFYTFIAGIALAVTYIAPKTIVMQKNKPLELSSEHTPSTNVPIKLTVDRDEDPWAGLTNTNESYEKSLLVSARKVSQVDDNSIDLFDDLVGPNEYIFYRSKTSNEVSVNPKWFSTLHRANIVHGVPEAGFYVGKATKQGLSKFTPQQIAIILVRGQILITYVHLESELEVISGVQNDTMYRIVFQGRHHYCTNKCRWGPIAFVIGVNTQTGDITAYPFSQEQNN